MQGLDLILPIAILIFSVVIHEVSHGMVANWLGDPTAKYAGRLTLNPISHLDPVGSVILPVLLIFFNSPVFFAYAKPVPFNPYNLRNQRWGPALVGIAGPVSNILLAILFAPLFHITGGALGDILFWVIRINIALALFNLIPIPPLDGSKLLLAILPPRLYYLEAVLEQYGFFLLLILIFLLPNLLFLPISYLSRLILGLLGVG